jgi:hypothetical protein
MPTPRAAMTRQQPPDSPEPKKPLREVLRANWSDKLELGGSKSAFVACYAANQVLGTIWRGSKEDADTKQIRDSATLSRVSGIGPRDVIEAMLATQMVATHEAAMECFRRAVLPEQTFAGREMGLRYGDRLVRSFAALTDTLNRHRGKGQQVVRVEHVTVEAGGQAIVGAVTQGGGGQNGNEDQPHAQATLAHAPEPALRCQDTAREPVPVAGGERQAKVSDARRGQEQRRATR